MATANCPSCARPLEVDDAYRDWTVRCPHCGHEFVPSAEALPPADRDDDRPRRRRPRDDDDDYEDTRDRDRDEDRDDHDRDRDEEDDGSYRRSARAEALQEVSAPATWLEICGWLTALVAVGLTLLCFALANEAANNPPARGNRNDEPAAVLVFAGCCVGVLGAPYGVVMAIGARKMRDLSSRGWALTGAILGVAAFSLFGFFGLIQAGIGAWALVALDKPAVREAFGLPGRRRRRRRDRDD